MLRSGLLYTYFTTDRGNTVIIFLNMCNWHFILLMMATILQSIIYDGDNPAVYDGDNPAVYDGNNPAVYDGENPAVYDGNNPAV